METEQIKFGDQEIEEGEISDSDDGYIPLQRPTAATNEIDVMTQSRPSSGALPAPSDSEEDHYLSTESTEDSDSPNTMLGGRKKKKRKEVKVKPMKPARPVGRVRPEKYNIWAASLQDDLMENMRGCEVNNHKRDREVESYDYRIKYRLNGETEHTGMKRRQSYSDDSDTYNLQESKKFRGKNHFTKRVSAKQRLGKRQSDDSCNSSDGINSVARHILDLNVTTDCSNEEVAQDIAMKLCEEKDDLLLHAINVIGKDTPMKIFTETQKIELEGGMMTMDGRRRRTPGGVFLFLLKHCSEINKDDKKKIFSDDRKQDVKKKKKFQNNKRDQKVEQLKKSLTLTSGERERKDSLSLLKPDTSNPSLSNPPPSPVTDCNRESSPDIETKIVNKAESITPHKLEPAEPSINPVRYEDDFLDMHCDEMDLF